MNQQDRRSLALLDISEPGTIYHRHGPGWWPEVGPGEQRQPASPEEATGRAHWMGLRASETNSPRRHRQYVDHDEAGDDKIPDALRQVWLRTNPVAG
jgi:hypothetical protein